MTKYVVRIRHTMYFDLEIDDADDEAEAEAIAWDMWDHDQSEPVEEISTCEYVEVVPEQVK